MFYRFRGHLRHAEQLDGMFRGSLFLLGGAKELQKCVYMLRDSRVVTLAMNNAGTVVRPHLWIGADGAEYYSASILHDPAIMKFMRIIRMDTVTQRGIPVRECPNMHFYKEDPEMIYNGVFVPRETMIFWKNVFVVALQLAWRLGFSRVYCVGCGFKAADGYAFKSRHVDEYEKYNQNTYDAVLRQLQHLLPHAKAAGLDVVSCTPDSRLGELDVRYEPIRSAIDAAAAEVPSVDTENVKHPKDELGDNEKAKAGA